MKFILCLRVRVFFLFVALILSEVGVILTNSEENILGDYEDIFNNLKEHTKNSFLTYKHPKNDFLRVDDVGEDELEDIIALSEAKVDSNIDIYGHVDKMTIADVHNIYRRNLTNPIPEGSDVMYTEWNDTLAWAAGEWLKECQLKHGFAENDNITKQRGQNLYKGPSMLPSRPIYLWYQEYKNYFFHNFSCKEPSSKYQCGHMTQVLWFDSAQIGCARRSYCFPKEPLQRLVNCYYYRQGNLAVPGMQIYKYGKQCTRCDHPDGNFCYHGLCANKKLCDKFKFDCECKLDCKNCVKPNPKTCRCERCKDGWDWSDCSHPCYNAMDKVAKKPGFCRWKMKTLAKDICKNKEVLSACRKECGACKSLYVNQTKKENMCCKGKMCPPYYILDEDCNCIMDCPSNLCLFPQLTTTENPVANTSYPNVTDTSKRGKKYPKGKKIKAPSKGRILSAFISITVVGFSIVILSI